MALRIGFAFNEKPSEEEEPPSRGPHDRFAEWDDPATIAAVASALGRVGEVILLEAREEFPDRLRRSRPDIVFNIAEGLNGPNREAHVPAMCEYFGVPYTGSDPLSLALALDKRRTKEVLGVYGVPTPGWTVAGDGVGRGENTRGRGQDARGLDEDARGRGEDARGRGEDARGRGEDALWPRDLAPPLFVKPLYEGSSKGIDVGSLCPTWTEARARIRWIEDRYGQPALVEEFLPGREFTVAVLGNGPAARVLPPVEILFDSLPAGAPPLYGWEAKWIWDQPQEPLAIFHCPARLEPALETRIAEAALGAFHALGCRDWARVDLRLDAAGAPHVLEVNPLPGILPDPRQNSCFPKAARAAGMDYASMIIAVLDAALERLGIARPGRSRAARPAKAKPLLPRAARPAKAKPLLPGAAPMAIPPLAGAAPMADRAGGDGAPMLDRTGVGAVAPAGPAGRAEGSVGGSTLPAAEEVGA